MTDQPTGHEPFDPTPGQPSQNEPQGGRRILPPSSSAPEDRTSSNLVEGKPTFAPGKMPPSGPDWSKVAVPLVASFIAVLAIFWFAASPEEAPFADTRDEIESIDDLNNESTEGAPQQEVVNGWTTIEYLNLLSTQQEHENNRRDALLLLILLSGLAAYTHHHLVRQHVGRTSEPSARE